MKIGYQEIAQEMTLRADFPITEKEARDFVREALVNTMGIVRRSKGKLQVKNCDVQQFYKDIPWEELKAAKFDLDETKDLPYEVRMY